MNLHDSKLTDVYESLKASREEPTIAVEEIASAIGKTFSSESIEILIVLLRDEYESRRKVEESRQTRFPI